MKLIDIVRMAIHNLWQRRWRTIMNMVGVVIGCIVLLMTATGATGVRAAFQALFDSSEFARQIQIYQRWATDEEPPESVKLVEGDMSDERRERIRTRKIRLWKQETVQKHRKRITDDNIRRYELMDHVVAVVPHIYLESSVSLKDGTSVNAGVTAAGPPSTAMKRSIVAGDVLADDDKQGALIHEFLAYQLGFHSDQDLKQLIGQTISIEWTVRGQMTSMFHLFSDRIDGLTPELLEQQSDFLAAFTLLIGDIDHTTLSEDQKGLLRSLLTAPLESRRSREDLVITKALTIRGVYREGANENLSRLFYQQLMGEEVEVQIQRHVAAELQKNDPEHLHYYDVVAIVDSSAHLKEVSDAIEADGLRVYSALGVVENINGQIDRNSWVVLGVAAAILITAAIGISNTLMISVMERTPEFGIMKALGAKDRHLVLLMMTEGAILGLFGAVLAVLFSWLLSFVVQIFLRMYIENQISGNFAGSLFHFSLLPCLLTLLISVSVCTLASVLPAVRAARLDPVIAMQRT